MHSIRAAVLRDHGDIAVESLELAGPESGEVLVDLAASGVCHTDYHFYAGEMDVPLPVVLGHEGAGTVTAVGDGVRRVEPGDRVVLSLLPSCGHCEYCAAGRPYLCQSALDVRFEGTLANGERRLHGEAGPVNHFYAQSSFATDAVVTEESVVPVGDDVPLETAAAFGCGATTGIGAVLNTADVEAGDRVAIFGCGNTGMSAVMAADAAGASAVVAVDVDARKLDAAREFGATTTVDGSEADPVERIDALGGVDYAFEFVGHADEVREQAIAAVDPGGTVVLSGATDDDATVDLAPVVGGGKTIRSNVAGSARPLVDIPRYAAMDAAGDIDVSGLVDASYDLDDAERALEDLIEGRTVKPVLRCD
jgi:Zn-dependent alcohol dehydrogenase